MSRKLLSNSTTKPSRTSRSASDARTSRPTVYLDVVVAYTIMSNVSMHDIPDEGDEAQHHADGQEPKTRRGRLAPISSPQNLQISRFVNGERRQFAKGSNDI